MRRTKNFDRKFEDLPVELRQKIIGHSKLKDILKLRRVNKNLKEIIDGKSGLFKNTKLKLKINESNKMNIKKAMERMDKIKSIDELVLNFSGVVNSNGLIEKNYESHLIKFVTNNINVHDLTLVNLFSKTLKVLKIGSFSSSHCYNDAQFEGLKINLPNVNDLDFNFELKDTNNPNKKIFFSPKDCNGFLNSIKISHSLVKHIRFENYKGDFRTLVELLSQFDLESFELVRFDNTINSNLKPRWKSQVRKLVFKLCSLEAIKYFISTWFDLSQVDELVLDMNLKHYPYDFDCQSQTEFIRFLNGRLNTTIKKFSCNAINFSSLEKNSQFLFPNGINELIIGSHQKPYYFRLMLRLINFQNIEKKLEKFSVGFCVNCSDCDDVLDALQGLHELIGKFPLLRSIEIEWRCASTRNLYQEFGNKPHKSSCELKKIFDRLYTKTKCLYNLSELLEIVNAKIKYQRILNIGNYGYVTVNMKRN